MSRGGRAFFVRVAVALAAAALLVARPAPSSAGEDPAALRGKFDSALSSGSAADAQAAGKKLLADVPEDAVCLHVLRAFLEKGWKWPRLRTSFATLRTWEGDVVDTAKEPDLRLALLDAIEDLYPKEEAVADGGTHYERAWTLLQAKRWDEAVKASREFLRRFGDSVNADKVRVVVLAPALLAKTPPDAAAARKVLEGVAADERSKYRERAARALDEMGTDARWIDVEGGCPRAAGLGKVALLTDVPADDDLWKALGPWREARAPEVIRFRPGRVKDAAEALRKLGPEFVAVAVRPAEVDTNLQWDMVELCRDLDGDPMPDFHFGYLVARDAADLRALAERSAAAKPREDPKLASVGVPSEVSAVAPFDAVLHFGHGQPTGIDGGLGAAALESAKLPRATLVVSGACYNAAVGRSWHPCTMQPSFCRAVEIEPKESIALAWLHAGAIGVVAATEADRGEMAGAEWASLRASGGRLGEIPSLSYRLAFTSLADTWEGMPRQRAGDRRSVDIFDVMLRGQLSRCLVGDPSAPLLAAPLDPPPMPASVRRDDAGRIVVEVRAAAAVRAGTEATCVSINTLTRRAMNGNSFPERRLWARVELPSELVGHLAAPEVAAVRGGAAIPLTRSCFRHEVWGGRRYVCVQAESTDGALVAEDASVTFTFAVAK
jgi:hypothetical protein